MTAYGTSGQYTVAHRPESVWPWHVVCRGATIARFVAEAGAREWIRLLERRA